MPSEARPRPDRFLVNALVLEVSLPSVRMDNFFENKSIGEDGVA